MNNNNSNKTSNNINYNNYKYKNGAYRLELVPGVPPASLGVGGEGGKQHDSEEGTHL